MRGRAVPLHVYRSASHFPSRESAVGGLGYRGYCPRDQEPRHHREPGNREQAGGRDRGGDWTRGTGVRGLRVGLRRVVASVRLLKPNRDSAVRQADERTPPTAVACVSERAECRVGRFRPGGAHQLARPGHLASENVHPRRSIRCRLNAGRRWWRGLHYGPLPASELRVVRVRRAGA